MQVTIVGAGNMGRGIGTRAVAGGHEVEIVDRDPAEAERLAEELGGVSDVEVRAILLASSPNVGFFAAAIVLAAVAPRAAAIGYLVIAAASVLRARGDQPAVQPS